MIFSVLLLTGSAYIAYRFLRFAYRFALVDEGMPAFMRSLLRWLVFLFQVLTCVGLSWIVLSFVDLVRNNP